MFVRTDGNTIYSILLCKCVHVKGGGSRGLTIGVSDATSLFAKWQLCAMNDAKLLGLHSFLLLYLGLL